MYIERDGSLRGAVLFSPAATFAHIPALAPGWGFPRLIALNRYSGAYGAPQG